MNTDSWLWLKAEWVPQAGHGYLQPSAWFLAIRQPPYGLLIELGIQGLAVKRHSHKSFSEPHPSPVQGHIQPLKGKHPGASCLGCGGVGGSLIITRSARWGEFPLGQVSSLE